MVDDNGDDHDKKDHGDGMSKFVNGDDDVHDDDRYNSRKYNKVDSHDVNAEFLWLLLLLMMMMMMMMTMMFINL